MRQFLFILIGVLLAGMVGNDARAFGADGHEAVCEIAYRELTDQARESVDALIALDDDIATFRDSCVWPDFRGAIQQSRRSDHYINIPRNWTSIWYQRCHQADHCLFTAISDDAAILSDEWTSDTEKLIALKFLGHWVGDIHQPLHVSYGDDRGGNNILVNGVTGCRRNGQTKLHAVWDTCIPRNVMQDLDAADVADDDDDREAFGVLLRQDVTDAQRTEWTTTLSPLDWANESLAIARRQDVGYCTLQGNICAYSPGQAEFEENDHLDNEGMRTFSPTGDYEGDFSDEVAERMQMAGVRLGAMLNRIFAD